MEKVYGRREKGMKIKKEDWPYILSLIGTGITLVGTLITVYMKLKE